MKLEDLQWEDNFARECALKGGSKAGFYRFLNETSDALRPHLPKNSLDIEPGQDYETALSKFKLKRNQPQIVRGYLPEDMVGLVDVLDTQKDVFGKRDIRQAIEAVRNGVGGNVKSFYEYEFGKALDISPGILVQPQMGDVETIRGSILENPHTKGIHHIGIVRQSGPDEDVENDMFGDNGQVISDGLYNVDENTVKEVVRLYKNVRDSGFIPSSHSFQMEFVLHRDRIYVLQARVFRPFEPAVDFEVPVTSHTNKTRSYESFGITPPEGVKVHVVPMKKSVVEAFAGEENTGYVFSHLVGHESSELDVQPKNISAYFAAIPRDGSRAVWEHGHYRWITKSPLAVVVRDSDLKSIWTGNRQREGRECISRTYQLFLNGVDASFKEVYLN